MSRSGRASPRVYLTSQLGSPSIPARSPSLHSRGTAKPRAGVGPPQPYPSGGPSASPQNAHRNPSALLQFSPQTSARPINYREPNQIAGPSGVRDDKSVPQEHGNHSAHHEDKGDLTTSAKSSPTRGSADNFPQKLYILLNNESMRAYIRWTNDGKGFTIPDPRAFEAHVLSSKDSPFRTQNYDALVRQANAYGFHKVRTEGGTTECEFRHDKFRRGHLEDLKAVIRNRKAPAPGSKGAIGAVTVDVPRGATRSPSPDVTTLVQLTARVAAQQREIADLQMQLDRRSVEHSKTREKFDSTTEELERVTERLEKLERTTSLLVMMSQITNPPPPLSTHQFEGEERNYDVFSPSGTGQSTEPVPPVNTSGLGEVAGTTGLLQPSVMYTMAFQTTPAMSQSLDVVMACGDEERQSVGRVTSQASYGQAPRLDLRTFTSGRGRRSSASGARDGGRHRASGSKHTRNASPHPHSILTQNEAHPTMDLTSPNISETNWNNPRTPYIHLDDDMFMSTAGNIGTGHDARGVFPPLFNEERGNLGQAVPHFDNPTTSPIWFSSLPPGTSIQDDHRSDKFAVVPRRGEIPQSSSSSLW
ncbi:stress-responsive transcription factor hsf1 [Tulasnella sp. JGI-2019a]|nr:stress-responsive transcription factor hsf1 [Tulasnella sp. JGI-2019a]